MAEEVSSIGVRLTLDASGFTTPMQEATGALNAFQAQAERAASGVAQTRAGGGASKSSAASPAAQNLTGVNVSLEITPQSLAKLRKEVAAGLGAIPVTITPQFATTGKWSVQNIMGSMLSMQYGVSHTRGVQLSKQAIEEALGPLPKKAHGGPVQAGRPIIVGERRPEVFVPQSHGRIESNAREFVRQQERARRFEMELATLEQATQKRHEQNMARIRGGGVRGYGYKYGAVSAGQILGTRPEQQAIIPADPRYLYHGTDQMRRRGYYTEDIRKHGVRPVSTNWHDDPGGPVSFWATEPRVARGYGTYTLRTPRDENNFFGPYDRWGEYSGNYQEMTTRRPVTRQRLQYWGEDEQWHRFRKGRRREEGGPVEHAYRGKGVRGYGGKYGSARPAPSNTYPEYLNRLWGDPGAADPGYLYHGASHMNEIRGRYYTDRGSGISPRGRAGDPYSYWATSGMVAPLYSGTSSYGGGGSSATDVGLLRARPSSQFEESWPGARPDSPAGMERRTSSRVPRSSLQYWGEDNDWHRFRRGRRRMAGGPVVEGGVDWRQMPNWRTVPRVEHVRVSSLLPFRQQDRESHPRYAHDYAYLDELTEKIGAEGFDPAQPVIVHYDPFHHAAMVADGNHRIAVARRLGMETIPTTVTLVQRRQSKFRGSRMPGESSILPDETGYVPGTLPPSWIGLRQDGGPVWKKLLQQGVITTRNMGRRAERYYHQRYRGFDEHGLLGMGGPGRDAFDRLVQAAGYEGDTNWNQFEAEFDMDFGRKVGFNTSFASRANLHEKLGQLMPIEPLMSISGKLRKLFEASPDMDEAEGMANSALALMGRGLGPAAIDRIKQAEDVVNMTRDTLGSIDRRKAMEILERDYKSAGMQGHVGTWSHIEGMLSSLPRRNAIIPETRPWFSGSMSSWDKAKKEWLWGERGGGAKDRDLLPGQYTREDYSDWRETGTPKWLGTHMVDTNEQIAGHRFESEGLGKLTAGDFRDPTQFTEAGYKTIYGLLGPDRRNAMGGRVKHAWRGLTAEAFRQTTDPDIRGGTFPTRPDLPVPTEGNAVGIARFLAEQTGQPISTIKVDPNDPIAFMRAFHKMKRAGAPYVGTWWPEGRDIAVDPATVIARRDEANLVAHWGGEEAGYQLRKTPAHPYGFEWQTRNPKLEAEAGRIADIIHGRTRKRRRQGGGPVFELEGVHPILAPRVQATVERLLGQYPMVGEHLTRVTMTRGFQPYAAYESAEAHGEIPATPTSYAIPAAEAVPGTIHLSPVSASKSGARDFYTPSGAMKRDKGFHVPGTSSIEGNVTHEFGHALRRHIERLYMGEGTLPGMPATGLKLPETAQQLFELENLLKADPRVLREREPGFEKFYGISPYAESTRDMPSIWGGGAFEPLAELFSALHTPGGKWDKIPEPLLDRMEKMLFSLKLGRSRGGPAHASHGVQFDLQGMRGDLRSRVTDTLERLLDRYPMIGGSPYAANANTSPGHPSLGYVGMSGREPYAEYGHPDMAFMPGSQGYGGRRFRPGIMNFSMEAFGVVPKGPTRPIMPSRKAWWQPAVDTEWSRSYEYFDRLGLLLPGNKPDPLFGHPIDRTAQFSPGTASAEGIATHEFGHAVDYYLQQTAGLGSPQQWIRDDQGLLIPDPTTLGAKYQAMQRLLMGHPADTISGYSSTARLKRPYSYHPRKPTRGDPAEPWAELFGAIETPGASAKHVRPRRMVTSMQEILEELRGGRHAATGTRRAKQAPYFLGRARKNIEALASRIDPRMPEFQTWRDWYTIAHAQALGDMADFGLAGLGDVGLGAYAAASPGKRWPTERAIMREILRTGGQSFPMSAVTVNVPGYSPVSTGGEAYGYSNRRKAADIIRTQSLVDAQGNPLLSGPKVVPFHGNLTGKDVEAKTLDARMSQIAGVYEIDPKTGKRVYAAYPPGWRRSVLEQAYGESYDDKYRKAWSLNDFSEFQAILWSAVGEGPDLGRDWTRTKSGIAIPRHPGLVVPFHRADGGYVEKLMGTWEPWMGYQLAMEAAAKRKEAKHAQGGAFTHLERGAHSPFGEEWFHYLPDLERWPGIPMRLPAGKIHHPSASQLLEIDMIRDQALENGLVMWPNSGDAIARRVQGTPHSVNLGDVAGKVGVHNHPGDIGQTLASGLATMYEKPRPSNADLVAHLGGRGSEAWVVTPSFTSIMRGPGWASHKLGRQLAAATSGLVSDIYLDNVLKEMEALGLVAASHAKSFRMGTASDVVNGGILDLINSGPVSMNFGLWDRVMASVGEATGLEYLRLPNRLVGAKGPKGMDRETLKRLPTMMENKVIRLASGGDAPQGVYIVNEIGKELFVPNRLAGMIPPKVLAQIPKAKDGAFVIDQPPNSLFFPPEDGIIVPNRLMNQVPHAARGTRDEGFSFEPEGIRGPFGTFVKGSDIEGGEDGAPAWVRDIARASFGALRSGGLAARLAAGPPPGARGTVPPDPAPAGPAPDATSAGAPPRTPEPPRGRHGAGSPDGVTRVFVTNWPSSFGSGTGRTRVGQAGPGDFQAQHGAAPTEEGSAPPRRARPGTLPEEREREYQMMREQASVVAQSLAARTPRGMAAVAGSMIFGGRGENVALIARQRRLIDQMQGHEAGARGRMEGGTNVGQAETDAYLRIMNEDLPLARGAEKKALEEQITVLKDLNPELGKFADTEAALAKTAPGAMAGVKNFAGILAGVQIYSMAMQGLGYVMEAVGPAINDVADQMLGWQAISSKTVSTMAKGIRESHGNVEAVVSQTAANAGLSKSALDFVSDAVASAALIRAGAQAQAETGGLFRSAMGVRNTTSGLYGGYGGVLDSGLFAQQMGGGAGYTESIQGFFDKGAGGVDIPGSLNTGLKFLTDEKYRNFVAGAAKDQGNPLGAISEIPGGVGDMLSSINPFGKNFGSTFLFGMKDAQGVPYNQPPAADTGPFVAPVLKDASGVETEAYGEYMADLNKSIDRGAAAVGKSATAHWDYAKSQDEINQATKAAIAAGDDYGLMLAQQGVVLRDNTQTVIDNGEAYRETNEYGVRGKTIVESSVWAVQSKRQLDAQRQANALQAERGINVELPFEMAKQLLMNPLITPGASFFPGSAGGKPGVAPSAGGAGLSSGARNMAQAALGQTAAANVQLQQIADKGLAEARAQIEQFLTPDDLKSWDSAVGTSQTLSAEIAKLSTNMSRLNMEASQASWGNQIRLAKRALGDALAMQGKAGGERLGYLQREQWLISRASQALNLALQQRQITTQIALAGFQAPGETGEERYMRQKEKLAEAAIAQKQLGYSQQEYRVAGEMWTESAKRAATDAQKAIEVMTKARDAEAVAISSQEAIAKKQQLLAHSVGVMDKLMGQATGNWQGALSAAANGVSDFAGSVNTAVKEIYTVLGYKQNRKTGTWSKTEDPNAPGQAAGLLGVTTMPSKVTFGEAGTEAVAILKNPRMGSLAPEGGGGGAASVTVNINGPVVREDKDISRLARAVADEVERSLSRKGQLLGLRSPAY